MELSMIFLLMCALLCAWVLAAASLKHILIQSLKAATPLVVVILVFQSAEVLAALPTVEDPSRGAGGGILETAQNHLYDASFFIALVIATVVFFVAAKAAIAAYNEIGDGRGSWSKLAITVVIGIILIVAVIWLVTQGSGIL